MTTEQRIVKLEEQLRETNEKLGAFLQNAGEVDSQVVRTINILIGNYIKDKMVLNDISDINIVSPTNNQVLKYSTSPDPNEWVNGTDQI